MRREGKLKYVVELKDVTFAYDHRPVLKNINLRVAPGEFFSIIGANGSAKTTLIKIMLGLLRPKLGQVKLMGQDIGRFKDWGKLGYVSQQASDINSSFPATVAEVVASGYYGGFARLFHRLPKGAVEDALDQVGIKELSHRRIGELSGGQRQRAFLARALVGDPQVIFLDEPTTGVDADSRRDFYSLLGGLHRQGVSIIMVTHDMVALAGDKTWCLVKDGQVQLQESKDEFQGGGGPC